MSKRVFLGGTCNGSNWREELIKLLKIDYFNPVVKDWTEECQKNEIIEKDKCNVHLYVITPKIAGVYSIAEAVESAMSGKPTIFCVLKEHEGLAFNEGQITSFKVTEELIKRNNGFFLWDLNLVADCLNSVKKCEDCAFTDQLHGVFCLLKSEMLLNGDIPCEKFEKSENQEPYAYAFEKYGVKYD